MQQEPSPISNAPFSWGEPRNVHQRVSPGPCGNWETSLWPWGSYQDYYRALAGLAQVRAAQQRYPETVDLYRKAIAIVPLPDYAAALGDVYTKLERHEDAQKQYDLVEYIGYLNTLNKVLYNRELAYFSGH